MATPAVTYTFAAHATAIAAQVNTNFSDLTSFITTNAIQKDGSLAMTAALTLSGDPTTSNHATRKSYVDGKVPAALTTYTPVIRKGGVVMNKTVLYSKYVINGTMCSTWVAVQILATGGAGGGGIDFDLPVAHAFGANAVGMGGGRLFRAGSIILFETFASSSSTTSADADPSTLVSFPVLAVDDYITWVCNYPVV